MRTHDENRVMRTERRNTVIKVTGKTNVAMNKEGASMNKAHQ